MSLFEKYGGERYWETVITAFLGTLWQDEQLGHFFAGANQATMHASLVTLFRQALGFDPGHFPTSIRRAHSHLDIKQSHFDRFVEIFHEEIVKNGVTEDDVREIMDVLLVFKQEVVKKT